MIINNFLSNTFFSNSQLFPNQNKQNNILRLKIYYLILFSQNLPTANNYCLTKTCREQHISLKDDQELLPLDKKKMLLAPTEISVNLYY